MQAKTVLTMTNELINATGKYVGSKINNPKERKHYELAIAMCSSRLEAAGDIEELISDLSKVRELVEFTFKPSAGLFGPRVREYSLMAIDHCVDAANSINTRFVTGGSSNDEQFLINMGFIDPI